MTCGIYKIYFKNTPNKFYIGSSLQIENRKKQHLSGLRRKKHENPILQYVFNKYGEDKMVFEILEEVEVLDDLIEREKFYYCQAIDDGFTVYNIIIPDKPPTNTGRTRFKKGMTPWNKGKTGVYSKDQLIRMSENGKARTDIIGKPFAKGNLSCNKGKKMSKEHCEKLSKTHKGQVPWFVKKGVKPPSNTGRTRFKSKV